MESSDPKPLWQQLARSGPFELREQEAYLNLARTHAELSGAFHTLFRAHGLSEASYNALRIIRGAGNPGDGAGCRCSDIARDMVVRVPDVTRLVDRLVDGGLVSRDRSDADRRVVVVRLTSAGADLLARLDEPVIALHRAQFEHLGADELDALNRLLTRARTNPPPPTGTTPPPHEDRTG